MCAAEELFLAQPAVSMQIKKLENDSRLVLTGRNSKKISLTDASRVLHQASRDNLDVNPPLCNIRVR
jgi:DNA-binding transcriptional LysR family regulator